MEAQEKKTVQNEEQLRINKMRSATQLYLYQLQDLRMNEEDLSEVRIMLEQYTGCEYKLSEKLSAKNNLQSIKSENLRKLSNEKYLEINEINSESTQGVNR